MYSKQEATLIKRDFWRRFGQYMRPLKNSAGENVNWLNYKTGVRQIYFRLDVKRNEASVAIEIRHHDPVSRSGYFEKLNALKLLFREIAGEEWEWNPAFTDEDGIEIAKIAKSLADVNVFNENDWPAIISFLKSGIMALDKFWVEVKEVVAD